MENFDSTLKKSEQLAEFSRYEEDAFRIVSESAEWLCSFYEPNLGLFLNGISGSDSIDEAKDGITPNAATNLVVLSHSRITGLGDLGLSAELQKLDRSAKVAGEKLRVHDTNLTLPLDSFGVLPLFTTSFLLNALVVSCDKTELAELPNNLTFEIALRRVLSEMLNAAGQRSQLKTPLDPVHPYVLWYIANSFRLLLKQSEKYADIKSGLSEMLSNNEDFNREISIFCGRDGEELKEELLAATTTQNSEGMDKDSTPPLEFGTIRYALRYIEEQCATQLNAFIVESTRTDAGDIDPSALAFVIQILNDTRSPQYMFAIQKGLDILTDLHAFGQFPAGQAFHCDDKGRSLFVPSIEISNVVVRVFISRLGTIRDRKLFKRLISLTHSVHKRLGEQIVPVVRPDGIQGWCTDRALSRSRIETWVTIQALEFFVSRVALLRALKRRFVFENYSWQTAETVAKSAPLWADFVDPNLGTRLTSLKDLIVRAASEKSNTQAPIFMLFGPPGTSKTTFSKAFASMKHWDIVYLSPSDFLTESADRIETRSREIFNDIMNLNDTVILLDEMDSLFRSRRGNNVPSVLDFVVPAFLTKLQDLRDYSLNRRIAVFINTNFYEKIDRAVSRAGRIDNHLLVLPYSRAAQEKVVDDLLVRQRITEPEAAREKIAAALHNLPCVLGYRDIDRIVSIAGERPNISCTELCGYMEHSGIQPDEYAFKLREGAFVEFVNFAQRLSATDMDHRQFDGDEPAAVKKLEGIKDVLRGFEKPKKDLHELWFLCIEDWQKELRNV